MLSRCWGVLGAFIRGQAVVGLVDAVLIGVGLVVLGVPLALPLAVLTFFGGFIPIVGAVVVGALAALVALVTNGVTTALIVLAIVWSSRSRATCCSRCCRAAAQPAPGHRAAGGHRRRRPVRGGRAFLSVPFAAVVAVVLRYLGEVLQVRTGEPAPDNDDADRRPAPAEPGAGDIDTASAVDVAHDVEQAAQHGGQVAQPGAGQ